MARHVWFAICVAVYLPGIWSQQSRDWRIVNRKLSRLQSNLELERARTRNFDNELKLERARTDDLELKFDNELQLERVRTDDLERKFDNELKLERARTDALERTLNDHPISRNAVEENSKTAVKVMENFAKSIKLAFKSEKLRLRNITGALNLKLTDLQLAVDADKLSDSGVDGLQGEKGNQGLIGPPGAPGQTGGNGETGAQGPPGEQGHTGEQGPTGARGLPGADGRPGRSGPQGDPGYAGTGSSYVRWGRTTCPTNGTTLAYSGYMGGGKHDHPGAAVNYLCLTADPIWDHYDEHVGSGGKVSGVEYETWNHRAGDAEFFGRNMLDQDAPCALCHSPRSAAMMIPGRNRCYPGWTQEYSGYLMSGATNHNASSEYICVDRRPEVIPGGVIDTKGAKLLYLVEGMCGPLKCPPYIHGRELTCVVCTK